MYLFKNATKKEVAGLIVWILIVLFVFAIPFIQGLLKPKQHITFTTVTIDLAKCSLNMRSSKFNMEGNSKTETQNEYGEFRILYRYGCEVNDAIGQYVHLDIPRDFSKSNNLIVIKTPIKLLVWVNNESGYLLSSEGESFTSIWCEPMKEYKFRLVDTQDK
ncbi:MAG: hypothetical protein AB7F23_10185 [Phycisphaerae bacterium]